MAWEENLPYSLEKLPIQHLLKPINLNPYSCLIQKSLKAKKQKTKIAQLGSTSPIEDDEIIYNEV